MTNETEIIRYNLKDRGRKFRGTPRNFDIPAIVKAINSGATQEKVKHRDMYGYYGHWPRVKFGMNPSEGGVVDGKQVAIEPAMVTTYLKAFDDGTIEHRAEFFDTNAGKLAQTLFKRKAGGFSSAIDEIKPEFFGFDYVLEPNFSTNRGYEISLDGVANGIILDDVAINDYNQQLIGVFKLLDSLNTEHEQALSVVARLQQENEHYLSMLSANRLGNVSLDSLEGIVPMVVPTDSARRFLDDAKSFHTQALEKIAEPVKEAAPPDANDRVTEMFARRGY